MKLIPLLVLSLSLPCLAQTLTLTCPPSVKAGTTLACTAALTNNQGAAGVQFTVTSPSILGTLTITAAGSAINASKSAYQTNTSVLIGGFGPPPTTASLNSGQMTDGVVANLSWQVPQNVGNQTVQISLAGSAIPALATSASGSIITATPNPPQSVVVLPSTNFCDINGDGLIDQSDVAAQRTLVMTFPQPANCARNANGCNIAAVQIVANAALGGLCTASQ